MIKISGVSLPSVFLALNLQKEGIKVKLSGVIEPLPPLPTPLWVVEEFKLKEFIIKEFTIDGKHYALLEPVKATEELLLEFLDLGGEISEEEFPVPDIIEKPSGTYSVEVRLVKAASLPLKISANTSVVPGDRLGTFYLWGIRPQELPFGETRIKTLQKWVIFFDPRTGNTQGIPAVGRANGFPGFNGTALETALLDARLLFEFLRRDPERGARKYIYYFLGTKTI